MELGRFLSMKDVYKNAVMKMIPGLEDKQIETDLKVNVKCPKCGDSFGTGILFYRIKGDSEWIQAGETFKCSECRAKEAFLVFQKNSLEELRESVAERLTKDYFLLPNTLKDAGFTNFEDTHPIVTNTKAKAFEYLKKFLQGDKYSILFMGNPGTGKSHLCAAIARNIREKGYSVGFLTTGKLLSMFRASFDNENVKKGYAKSENQIFNDIEKLDLLILDDLGSEAIGSNSGDWRKTKIFEIVESRSGKPTIYTSNYNDKELGDILGLEVLSRLYDTGKFIDVFVKNYDYRKFKQIDDEGDVPVGY